MRKASLAFLLGATIMFACPGLALAAQDSGGLQLHAAQSLPVIQGDNLSSQDDGIISPNPIDISEAVVTTPETQVFMGFAIEPPVKVFANGVDLIEGEDYTVDYANNINVGTAKVTITGKNNYTGKSEARFTIIPASISKASIGKIGAFVYNGKARTPKPSIKMNNVKLSLGTDYTLSYNSNTNAGTAKISVKGKGNFSGSKLVEFKIAPLDVKQLKIGKLAAKVYKGKAYKPVPAVKFGKKNLKRNGDFNVSYTNNVNAGKAKVTITGKGNFKGNKSVSFTIKRAPISKAKVSKVKSRYYTGKDIWPAPSVKIGGKKLKEDVDFELWYANNRNVGTAWIIVRGIGNYKGEKYVSFKIVKKPAKKSSSKAKASKNATTGNSGGTVYITSTGGKYHRDGCRYLSSSQYAISRSNAISQGYEPCKVCNP